MNGIHDMGGMHGLGPIEDEPNEPVFHAHWEARALALLSAMGATGKVGYSRYALERLPAVDYLRMSYYEKLFTILVERLPLSGLVTREEIASGKPAHGSLKATPALTAAQVTERFARRGGPRPQGEPAQFHAGQHVRARNLNPLGHTRLPRYARGRQGTIETVNGVFGLQDTDAEGRPLGGKLQHVYSVRFPAREVWGENASPRDAVYIDLWEDYLNQPNADFEAARLAALPQLPRDEGGPVFAEPWQAQAFALAVQLSEQGHFTWKEWAAALAEELKAAAARGEPDDGSHYYEHWLATLERLVTAKGLSDRAAMSARKEAWADAYRHTPHGKPIELSAASARHGDGHHD